MTVLSIAVDLWRQATERDDDDATARAVEAGHLRRARHQVSKVVRVEGTTEPLDGTREVDRVRDRRPVRADDVDLRIELAVPPAANRLYLRPGQRSADGGEFQGLTDQRFHSAISPTRPSARDNAEGCVGPTSTGLIVRATKNRKVET